MEKIIYEEFGVRSEIIDYRIVGSKLKGMKDGKPFTIGGKILINVGGDLCEVEEIKFYSSTTQDELKRIDVCLDTDTRIAGVFVNNKNEVLLLKVEKSRKFYCFPGGHKRECESTEECLKREMEEEVGIDISGYEIELLHEMQEEGFGPEKFFLINVGDDAIDFRDEDPSDETSKLMLMPITEVYTLDNIFPKEVVEALKAKRP